MAVIRVHKTEDYTVMSNTHFREKNMSLKAMGLLSLMLSLPDDWDYSIMGLTTLSKDGKDSVMSALNELEKLGYLKRSCLNDEYGRFAGYDYDIYEQPQAAGTDKSTEEPYAEKPYAENPNTEKPNTEKPHAENPRQLNTNIQNTQQLKTKQLNTNNKTIDDCFERLWKLYPRKTNKGQVSAATKRKLFDIGYDKIARCIERYKQELEVNRTPLQYTKTGSTFFNSGYIDYLSDDWVLIDNNKQAAGEQKQKNNSEDDDYISRAYRMMREYED